MTEKSSLIAVAGGTAAGLMETVIVQPLDMVKTRFQLQQRVNPSVFRGLVEVVQEGGILRLYRGLLPEMASTVPARTAMYTSYDFSMKTLDEAGCHPVTAAFFSGFVSGGPESVVVTPLQLVKVRLQAKEHLGRYKNTFDCAAGILRHEGVRACFLGLSVTILRNSVWNAGYFGAIRGLRELYPSQGNESHLWASVKTSVTGFICGATATCLNCPFDVAKSRIQQQLVVGPRENARYRGVMQTLGLVYEEGGIAALYKGFAPKCLRMACGGAIGIAVFELTCNWLS